MFKAKPPGTGEFCEICFWEDVPIEWRYVNKADYLGHLHFAQRNFAEFGACLAMYKGDVRKPSSADMRSENWKTIDEAFVDPERFALID